MEPVGAVGVHLRERDAAVVVDRLDVGDVTALEPGDGTVAGRPVRLHADALGDLGPVDGVTPVPAGVPVGEADAVALAQPEGHPRGALALVEAAVVAHAVGAQRGLVAVRAPRGSRSRRRRAPGGCRASPSGSASRSAWESAGVGVGVGDGSAEGVGGCGVGCGGAVGVGMPPAHGPPGSADATAEKDRADPRRHPGRTAPGHAAPQCCEPAGSGPRYTGCGRRLLADRNAQTRPARPMVGYNRSSR